MYTSTYWIAPINIKKIHWMLMIVVCPKYMFESPPDDNHKCGLLFVDSFFSNTELFDVATYANLNHFLVYCYNKETTVRINDNNQINRVPRIGLKGYQQPNEFDCGIFTIIHARKFALTVLQDNKEWLLKDWTLSNYYVDTRK